jgi:poly(3-hydroxybutyrate) depolymerase
MTHRHKHAAAAVIAAATLFGALHPAAAQDTALSAYNAKPTETSISGISSGAYMAVQFGTAWSSIIKGIGAIAGGPFGCAGGWASTALSTCMGGAPAANIGQLASLIGQLAANGKIDDPSNIANQKVYLFNGYNDKVVMRPVTNWLDTIYASRFGGTQAGNLFYQTTIGSGHAQVTLSYGSACSANGGDYINKCNYDQAGVILQHIYGALAAPNRGNLTGKLLTFNQSPYTTPAKPADDSLGEKGFVYVPADCAALAACRVHIALHGCLQSFDNIKDAYVRHAGYNEWADTNHIIVLYPQTQPSNLIPPFGPTNPQACWDWWGYLDSDPSDDPRYLTKAAPQVAAIKRMLDRLTSGTNPTPAAPTPTPATLIANDTTDTAIALAWTATPGAASYEIVRQDPNQTTFHSIDTINGLSFGDSRLKPKTQYTYKVRPILTSGPGAFTTAVTKSTHATVPRCIDPGTCKVN